MKLAPALVVLASFQRILTSPTTLHTLDRGVCQHYSCHVPFTASLPWSISIWARSPKGSGRTSEDGVSTDGKDDGSSTGGGTGGNDGSRGDGSDAGSIGGSETSDRSALSQALSDLSISEKSPGRLDKDGYPEVSEANKWQDKDQKALNLLEERARERDELGNRPKFQPEDFSLRAKAIDRSFDRKREELPDKAISQRKLTDYYELTVTKADEKLDASIVKIIRDILRDDKVEVKKAETRSVDPKDKSRNGPGPVSEYFGDSEGRVLLASESYVKRDRNRWANDEEQVSEATRKQQHLTHSELAYFSLEAIAGGSKVGNLRVVYRYNVVNRGSLVTHFRTAKDSRRTATVDGKFTPKGRHEGEHDGYEQWLGSPNVQSTAWMLSDHLYDIGKKVSAIIPRMRRSKKRGGSSDGSGGSDSGSDSGGSSTTGLSDDVSGVRLDVVILLKSKDER